MGMNNVVFLKIFIGSLKKIVCASYNFLINTFTTKGFI